MGVCLRMCVFGLKSDTALHSAYTALGVAIIRSKTQKTRLTKTKDTLTQRFRELSIEGGKREHEN